jgi:hypothetical protein
MRDRARDHVAVDAVRDPDAGEGKQHDGHRRTEPHVGAGARRDRAVRLRGEPDRAVRRDHGDADKPAQQSERIEQLEQPAALVENAQVAVHAERHALQQIAERDAEHERRHHTAGDERAVPPRAPARVRELVAELEADRPQDQRCQHQEHGDVEAREGGGVDHRPGREHGAGTEDEPHLVALPHRADRVDGDAPLGVGARDVGQQRRDAEVEAVHDRKADQQHAEQKPPDDAEGRVVERNGHGRLPHSAGASAGTAVCGSASASTGPILTYLRISTTSTTSRAE